MYQLTEKVVDEFLDASRQLTLRLTMMGANVVNDPDVKKFLDSYLYFATELRKSRMATMYPQKDSIGE